MTERAVRWQRGFLRLWAVLSIVWASAMVADLWARYPSADEQWLKFNDKYVIGIDRARQRAREIEQSDPEGSRHLIEQIPEAERQLAVQRRNAITYAAASIVIVPLIALGLILGIGWIARGFRRDE